MKKRIFLVISSICIFFKAYGNENSIATTQEKQNIHDRYGYFSFGFGFPALLGLNIGLRSQYHHHGVEWGIGIVPLVVIYEAHAFASYLYYPKPSLDSQFYFGFGMRGGYLHSPFNKHNSWFFSPGIILGKSYQNRKSDIRFFQAAVSPISYCDHKFHFIPSINFSFGFGF